MSPAEPGKLDRAGFLISVAGTLMAVFASCLLLYTSALIITQSLLPALRADEPGLARAAFLGLEFNGYAVLFAAAAYLLLGFIALALANRQARRARGLWQQRSS